MNDMLLEAYWSELPRGRENAATYERLCSMWRRDKRTVRRILHELSAFDNGDNYILIRSSHNTGFYKTDNTKEIAAYRAECLNRGKRTFAPLRKIDRVLASESGQLSVMNNLKATRIACGMMQSEVCQRMKLIDPSFDTAMLSKMECDRCLPTPLQLAHLAAIYGCTPRELMNWECYQIMQ